MWVPFSEEEWAQLERAASCAKVLKVEVDVLYSHGGDAARGCTVLAAGLVRNITLRKVKLENAPEEVKESFKDTLCSNTQLSVKVW